MAGLPLGISRNISFCDPSYSLVIFIPTNQNTKKKKNLYKQYCNSLCCYCLPIILAKFCQFSLNGILT